MSKQIVAVTLALAMVFTPYTALGEPAGPPQSGTADQQAMDKLLAPIALYPDALLAQTLACASSPDQVHEVSEWLKKNSTVTGQRPSASRGAGRLRRQLCGDCAVSRRAQAAGRQ